MESMEPNNHKTSKMKLRKAMAIAGVIVDILSPHCDTINIAGSCRRQKPEVKDIEIVCLPKMRVRTDVFGEQMVTDERTKGFIAAVNELGTIRKGSPKDGRLVTILLKQGVNIDLFIPQAHDYYRQFAIRTGSANYAAWVIAAGWRKIGWCGSDAGLRKIEDCIKPTTANAQWRCVNPDAVRPPVWESEQAFFDWLKVRWVAPLLRNR